MKNINIIDDLLGVWAELLGIYIMLCGFMTIYFLSENKYSIDNVAALDTYQMYVATSALYIVYKTLKLFVLNKGELLETIPYTFLLMIAVFLSYAIILSTIKINMKLICIIYCVVFGGKLVTEKILKKWGKNE